MIKIDTKELTEILDMMPAEQNLMLVGKHGIGKSQILTQYFEKKGMKVVTLFLGQMSDPGDLIGLPTKDEETGKTDFMPPYWFPVDGEPVVLFLDELNRARPEVLQTVMDLTLNRKLAGRSLPAGSRLISAVNDGDEYQLTDLDPALVSRFNIYQFLPSTSEWLMYATRKRMDHRVISFIQNAPDYLDGNLDGNDTGLEKTADRRAWEKVSDAISGKITLTAAMKKMVAGMVGVKAASQFCQFASEQKALGGVDVLLRYKSCEAELMKYELHQLSVVNESLMRYLETQKITDKAQKQIKENLPQYVHMLEKQERREVLAHLASLMGQQEFSTAAGFICSQVPDVYMSIMSYVDSI